MPNHITNTLTVTGPAEHLELFVAAQRGTQAYYPPPRWDVSNLARLKKYVENMEKVEELTFNNTVPVPEAVSAQGFSESGYIWQSHNWGTKWDAYNIRVTVKAEQVVYEFQTAWAPPVEWLKALAARWPDLTFGLLYEDEGWNFAGKAFGISGVVTDHRLHYDELNAWFVRVFSEDDAELDMEGIEARCDALMETRVS